MMKNIRIKFGCFLVGVSIKVLPKDWRSKRAIKNLISIEAIKVEDGKL